MLAVTDAYRLTADQYAKVNIFMVDPCDQQTIELELLSQKLLSFSHQPLLPDSWTTAIQCTWA